MKWWPSTAPVSDARPGGKYAITFEFPNNPEHNMKHDGEYIEVVQDQKVSYMWDIPLGMTTVGFTMALWRLSFTLFPILSFKCDGVCPTNKIFPNQ